MHQNYWKCNKVKRLLRKTRCKLNPRQFEIMKNTLLYILLIPMCVTGFAQQEWIACLSQQTGLSQQVFVTGISFPQEKISNYWIDGFQISDVNYHDGFWSLVLSKNTIYEKQQSLYYWNRWYEKVLWQKKRVNS